jgi:hypothetical protein
MGDTREAIRFTQATRFIIVAGPSDFTNEEWKKKKPDYVLRPPIHEDYALLKVLYMLRVRGLKDRWVVHPFKYEEPPVPIDLSGLQDTDVIFVVGHGNQNGIYAMGPSGEDGTDRFIDLLTKDGNLKTKRKNKDITIMLLSCRSGLGLYKGVARRLRAKLGRDVKVGGAIGFTFGSPRTYLGYNEVLIQGLPWFIDYPQEYNNDPTKAEKETSAREGKTITYEGKKAEIEEFKRQKTALEDGFKKIIGQLKSKEVNKALDELEKDFKSKWLGLMQSQSDLYTNARKQSNLEFDMWYDLITDGYLWTTGKQVTDAEVKLILKGDLALTDDGAASIK